MEFLDQIFILFIKGGLVMYPLLICSFMVVTITIERGMYFRQAQTEIRTLLLAVDQPLKIEDWPQVRAICANFTGIPAKMLAASFAQPFADRSQLEQIFDGNATLAVSDLRYSLDILHTIVTLSPLLGLLGTVTGMIQSFSIMSIKAGQTLAVTGGVGEALIATATGLCVAILALVAHSYYSHRINRLISDMEQVSNHILSALPRRNSL